MRITTEQKKVKSFYAGLGLLILGFYIIFIRKDNLGFIPSIIGSILILWKW